MGLFEGDELEVYGIGSFVLTLDVIRCFPVQSLRLQMVD